MADNTRLVETNPLVKLKRGPYSAMGNVPNIDGTIYLAELQPTDQNILASTTQETTDWHLFFIDTTAFANGTETVFRHKLDAFRALYAKQSAYATTAGSWATAVSVSIGNSDGTGAGAATDIQGGDGSIILKLPATIKASITGNVTGTADKAKALDVSAAVGSATLPVYINASGKPVACNTISQGKLDINISGTADKAARWAVPTSFIIADGTTDSAHKSVSVEVDGSDNVTLLLPSTITATLNGRANSALKLVNSSNNGLNVGTKSGKQYAIQFSNGVPAVYEGTLANNAATATTATKLATDAGGPSVPVYFSEGQPVAITSFNINNWLGDQIIPSKNLPKDVQERLFVTARPANGTDLSTINDLIRQKNNLGADNQPLNDTPPSDPIDAGDVVEVTNSENGGSTLYYMYYDSTSSGPSHLVAKPFSAGTASSASMANQANQLSHDVAFVISDGTNSTSVTSNLSENSITLNLPSTIKANLTGIADKAKAFNTSVAIGSQSLPIYINANGVPTACNTISQGKLDVNISGTADKAAKLGVPVYINGAEFDGTSSITTEIWGKTRKITIVDTATSKHRGTSVNVNGRGASNSTEGITYNATYGYELPLPSTIQATLIGNADTATTAQKTEGVLQLMVADLSGETPSSLLLYDGSTNPPTSTTGISSDKLTTGILTPDLFFPKYTSEVKPSGNISKGTWQAINTPVDMPTGTYIIQVKTQITVTDENNVSKVYRDIYSGVMSFEAGTTDSTDSDEILLHSAGAVYRIYMRVKRTNTTNVAGKAIIQYCPTVDLHNGDILNISFRRVL